MKIINDQLRHKELDLIQQTALFLEKYNDNLCPKDSSTTQESLTLDFLAE